jgi:hypothetical protein
VVGDIDHGIVREYGNLSFAVIKEAGHIISAYKPDVLVEIFRRSISGLDLASGLNHVGSEMDLPLTPDAPLGR